MPLYQASSMYCAMSNTDTVHKSNLCYGDSGNRAKIIIVKKLYISNYGIKIPLILGGPLLYNKNNQWYIYGVSSMALAYSNYTCNPYKPSYYAKVPYYMSWIAKNMAQIWSKDNRFYWMKNVNISSFFRFETVFITQEGPETFFGVLRIFVFFFYLFSNKKMNWWVSILWP